jgi:hypothetical protein
VTEERGFDFKQGHQNLLFHPEQLWGPPSLLCNCYRCLLPAWVK